MNSISGPMGRSRCKAIGDVFPGVTALAFDDVIVGPGSVVNGVRCLFANKRPVALAPPYLMEFCYGERGGSATFIENQ